MRTGEESSDDDDDVDSHDSGDSGLRAKRADEAGYFGSSDGVSSDSDDLSTPPRSPCLESISVPPVASPEGSFETSVMVFTDGGIEVDISAYGYAQGSEMEDSEEEGGHLHEHGENDDTNDAQNDDGALELERTRREEALAEAHDEQAVLKDEAEGDAA